MLEARRGLGGMPTKLECHRRQLKRRGLVDDLSRRSTHAVEFHLPSGLALFDLEQPEKCLIRGILDVCA